MSTATAAAPPTARQPADPDGAGDGDGAVASWAVDTASGLRLRLPPALSSLTTYVMLEQERWFEPEMSLVPLLVTPGMDALDIGANHGIYTLELARCSGSGRVWAFEPTSVPRARLRQSVAEAGLEARVTVVDAGLSDRPGQASFAVHDNSELNSREGSGARRETVRLQALDDYLEAHAPGVAIGFVKLDAEGDELRVLAGAQRFFATQSPVVLFELKHGRSVNTALVAAWPALGYGLFRWSAELELLLPFDLATAETAFALNLVAVRPAEQAALAARGLLLTAEAWAEAPTPIDAATLQAALAAWTARPALQGLAEGVGDSLDYAAALCRVAAAHLGAGLTPAQRVAALRSARDDLMVAVGGAHDHGPEAWVLLVHCLHALGEQNAAVQLGARVLQQWPAGDVHIGQPVVPPLRADLERPRSTPLGSWLRQMLAEFVATHSAYSSYFQPAAPARWAALLAHPDHGPGIERRHLLAHVLANQVAPVAGLRWLNDPQLRCNAVLWQGLVSSMRGMAPPAAASIPPAAAAAAAPTTAAEALLATLPVAAVGIVDVGASSLAHETEPYAPLVRAGRARVTGFEPDAQALAKLRRSFPDARTHRYLPHFIGDGRPATFHETEWSLTASLLPPHRAQLDRYHQLGSLVQEKARHAVQTVRLDDVIAPGEMDLLKIDVQGAERLVFDGAARRLDEALVVWTEVEMVPLYEGQPLFGDIDARLRQHGLQFLCFTGLATRPLASWPRRGLPAPRRQQQLWADAIYVPAPERLATLPADAAARLALLAHHVIEAGDLCHAALLRLDAVAGSDFAPRYLAAVQAGA